MRNKTLRFNPEMMLIIMLLALFLFGCSVKSNRQKLFGIKVYQLNCDYKHFADEIADIGINTVFASKQLCKQKYFKESLHDNNIELYTIFPVFYNPDTLELDSNLFAIDQFGNVAADDWVRFTCPSRISLRKNIIHNIVTFIKNYNPDGISLDFIRHFVYWEKIYPGTNPDSIVQTCYCDSCLKYFGDEPEIEIPDTLTHKVIIELLNNKYKKEWLKWRSDLISTMVEEIVKQILLISPNIRINIHAVPWRTEDFDNAQIQIAGQDLHKLSEYCDYISPMCYAFMVKQPPVWINKVVSDMKLQASSSEIVPSIQVKEEYRSKKLTTAEFTKSLHQAIKQPSSGVVFWSWKTLKADTTKLSIVKKILSESNY